MKVFSLFIAALLLFGCSKDTPSDCDCQFPFLTGNIYTPFLAVNGEAYWYNNACWKYLGPTKTNNDTPPSNPGTNSNLWVQCGDEQKDCASITQSAPIWTAGIYYPGDLVQLNGKVYIAFTQGNPMPGSPNDDIWALLCE